MVTGEGREFTWDGGGGEILSAFRFFLSRGSLLVWRRDSEGPWRALEHGVIAALLAPFNPPPPPRGCPLQVAAAAPPDCTRLNTWSPLYSLFSSHLVFSVKKWVIVHNNIQVISKTTSILFNATKRACKDFEKVNTGLSWYFRWAWTSSDPTER